MKKSLDIQKISNSVGYAIRYIYALHGLLDAVEADHFDTELEGARKEAKVADLNEGSFWWMQSHYSSAQASVLAANCLAEQLEKLLTDIDGCIPPAGKAESE